MIKSRFIKTSLCIHTYIHTFKYINKFMHIHTYIQYITDMKKKYIKKIKI